MAVNVSILLLAFVLGVCMAQVGQPVQGQHQPPVQQQPVVQQLPPQQPPSQHVNQPPPPQQVHQQQPVQQVNPQPPAQQVHSQPPAQPVRSQPSVQPAQGQPVNPGQPRSQPAAAQPQQGQPMGQPQKLPQQGVPQGQPQMVHPQQMGQPQMGQPQMGQPQMGQPQMGHPQVGQPQMGQPQVGHPQMGQPQMGQPQMGQPQMGQPQMVHPQQVVHQQMGQQQHLPPGVPQKQPQQHFQQHPQAGQQFQQHPQGGQQFQQHPQAGQRLAPGVPPKQGQQQFQGHPQQFQQGHPQQFQQGQVPMPHGQAVPQQQMPVIRHDAAYNPDAAIDDGGSWLDAAPGVAMEYKVHVDAGKEDCYWQYVHKGATFYMSAQVLKGGDGNIGIAVRQPSSKIVFPYQWKPTAEYEEDSAIGGYYSVCLDNQFGKFSAKLVNLYITTFRYDEWERFSEELKELDTSVSNFTQILTNVDRRVQVMKQLQQLSRGLESRDYNLLLANLNYVTNWSLVQCIVVITCGLFQVYFVRRLFESPIPTKGKAQMRA